MILSEAGRAWENITLNDHLHDWDVSNARDRAIEARTAELLAGDYSPFGDLVIGLCCDAIDLRDALSDMLPHLIAGDEAEAGRIMARRLRDFAAAEAAQEARIQIDREHAEAADTAAANLADDIAWDRGEDCWGVR